ncbi:hypothetical protein A8926_2230 [Saccharopolyspora spinosa]|uniref:Uncharacterized protein n=1 Tax=Saccharopolyspora spinosa TaxID=60894 RepID=A0A2N3XVG1_SACSN|nr:hypothetical protein A8926_2230 [Saccharopolyspora spinosa]
MTDLYVGLALSVPIAAGLGLGLEWLVTSLCRTEQEPQSARGHGGKDEPPWRAIEKTGQLRLGGEQVRIAAPYCRRVRR